MSNTKDGPGKGPVKPAAIIDLKATEIKSTPDAAKPEPGKPDAAKPTSVPGAASVPPVAAAGQAPGKTPDKATDGPAKPGPTGPVSPMPAAAAAKAGAAPTAAAKPEVRPEPAKAATKATAAPAAAASPRARGGGLLSGLTHLTAGLAGGFLALLGADTIGPKLGLPINEGLQQTTAQLAQRIAAVETEARARGAAPAGGDLAQKLAAAERRLAELDRVTAEVAELRKGQAQLAGDTQALASRATKPDATAPADAAQRLVKLEEQLQTLSTAAGTDPQKGRIPQLTAVTGKLADLETALTTQLTALRKGVTQELDSRLAQTQEASEAARSGTQRLDRDLAQAKGETTRLAQRVDTLKAAADQIDATLKTLQTETGGLKAELTQQLKGVARPQDVSGAITPVATRIASLEQSIAAVMKAEEDRRTNSERLVLALELGGLKRALDRGGPYAKELAEVSKVAGGRIDLKALEPFKAQGVPTLVELSREFRSIAHTLIEADRAEPKAGVVDRLLAGAKSIVKVRKTDAAADDKSTEAVVARMEAALKAGELTTVIAEAKQLSAQAIGAGRNWLDKVEARAAVERALAAVDEQLKSSLGGKAAPAKGVQ